MPAVFLTHIQIVLNNQLLFFISPPGQFPGGQVAVVQGLSQTAVHISRAIDVVIQKQGHAVFRSYQIGQGIAVKFRGADKIKLVDTIDGMSYLSCLDFDVGTGPGKTVGSDMLSQQ